MKLKRIEAIVATAIYVVITMTIYGQQTKNWENQSAHFLAKPFAEQGMSFSFYLNHLWPLMLFIGLFYMAFLVLNNWIVSRYFVEEKQYEKGLILSLAALFVLWFGFAYCEWLRHTYEHYAVWSYFNEGMVLGPMLSIMAFIICYSLLKSGILYLLKPKGNLTSRVARESLIAAVVILAVFTLLMTIKPLAALFWLTMSVYCFLMYCIDIYKLLPHCTRMKSSLKTYLWVRIPLSFVIFIPFGLFFVLPSNTRFAAFFVIWLCLNILLIPLVRYIYKQQMGHIAKLLNLETALGESSANLAFLRSQINPHFLFNILNTLYGTALVEEAEMTASGIQKLGDMMRFMLHENMQDRILLVREMEYLHHYIDLQKLRTALSGNVTVEHSLQDVENDYKIAPMLLIPFVENAFKHGISLNERSWIRINLYVNDGKLFFDVYNSIHTKSMDDPERNQRGIGLENVKQRLIHLYPDKHELSIRQTNDEYFVHLTIIL